MHGICLASQELIDQDALLIESLDQLGRENTSLKSQLETQSSNYDLLVGDMIQTCSEKSDIFEALQEEKTQKELGDLIISQYCDEILEHKATIAEKEKYIKDLVNYSAKTRAEALTLDAEASALRAELSICRQRNVGTTSSLRQELQQKMDDLAECQKGLAQLQKERDEAAEEHIHCQSEYNELCFVRDELAAQLQMLSNKSGNDVDARRSTRRSQGRRRQT